MLGVSTNIGLELRTSFFLAFTIVLLVYSSLLAISLDVFEQFHVLAGGPCMRMLAAVGISMHVSPPSALR